ncbi:hypothetical protein CPB84DRAFT_708990 [Gymnopilus junonius]|uniref:Uncharacterized protein n=1 Tax=Gymnopilus junonius TaxID=109634 RepID=A0A9P5TQL3_GYMJU|nr:hypothetical protein CPB84DRAFT_708990 [Gymnopilus junonius]
MGKKSQPSLETPPHETSLVSSQERSYEKASLFSGAHNLIIHGGTFTNVIGAGIITGTRALGNEDVGLEQEIYKGHGYPFFLGRSHGKVVAVKLHEGEFGKERCSRAAGYYQEVLHPNLPHLSGVSSLDSWNSFLVFDGEYEGTLDHVLRQALKTNLNQAVTQGLQTIS